MGREGRLIGKKIDRNALFGRTAAYIEKLSVTTNEVQRFVGMNSS